MNAERERTLIRRIQREADRESANKLIGFYYREIYAFVYKQVVQRELAMDLTQEIFIAVLQALPGYDEKKAGFRTWLYRIASNKAVDYFRSSSYKASQRSISIDSLVLFQETTLESVFADRQAVKEVLAELAKLPFDTQQIVRLKVYGEQSFREIACALSIPESTAKTRYYGAIKSIREKVTKE